MGRPVEFDREAVLERAVAAFWDNGYAATSVSQLVQATRLQPGSLYAAFESKRGLFFAALERYAAQSLARIDRTLQKAGDPLSGIEAVMRQLADSRRADAQRGCLLVNSVLELGRGDPAMQQALNRHLSGIEQRLLDALKAARAAGQLDEARPLEAIAKFLMTTIWGLRVLGGTGADRATAKAVVEQALLVLR